MITFVNSFFADCIFETLNIWLRVFAIIPLTTVSMIYEMYILCWIIMLTAILCLMFINNEMQDDYSIGSLVSCALFISQILSNMIALRESYFTRSKLKQLFEGFKYIDHIFKHKLQYSLDRVYLRKITAQELLWINVILLTDTIAMTYTHQATKTITVLYWYSFLPAHALRLRCLQLIMLIIGVNVRLRVIKKILLEMVSSDSKNDGQVWISVITLASDTSTERVAALKKVYNQLYRMVNLLNDCFGWSLLSICTSYFIDFITNCYWIFVAKITNGRYEVYILNGGLVVSLVLQLTIICWHCQECENYSKYIGSSIFKLAKPLGNKRYNDLVSEFSLQALHQTFAVSAKEFFHLNLDLLGSMIGAIVTYLVILIQFMFTERNGSKIGVPNSFLAEA